MTRVSDTQTAVEALSQGLGHDDRRRLAGALRAALTALPGQPGSLDTGLRRRFAEAADLLESYPTA